MSFGYDLRELRKAIRATQRQIADALQVTPNTFARWERDEVTPHQMVQGIVLTYLQRLIDADRLRK